MSPLAEERGWRLYFLLMAGYVVGMVGVILYRHLPLLGLFLVGAFCGVIGTALFLQWEARGRRPSPLSHSAEVELRGGPWDGRRVLVSRGVSWQDLELRVMDRGQDEGLYLVDWSRVESPRAVWRQGVPA